MELLTFFDWLFILTAILFNLLIAGIFIAQKHEREGMVSVLGRAWLTLFFPLLVVLVNYMIIGKESWILVLFGVIFIYMLVEFVLDYIVHYDFRAQWVTHTPYILLEYAALFSLIAIAINIDQMLSWFVAGGFWILMGSLVYLYAGRRKAKQV